MKAPLLEELATNLSRLIPSGAEILRRDLEKNVRALMQSGLERMDLVTRAEFDVQNELLQSTRIMLEAQEKRIHELEQRLTGDIPGS